MEIISYVLSGSLAHKDNIGNGTAIPPGDVQRMSAGRGVVHSEYNHSADQATHFSRFGSSPISMASTPATSKKHFQSTKKEAH